MTMIITKLSDLSGEVKEYRKKTTIKAVQLNDYTEVEIETREGVLKAYPGDFIAEGVEGEVYPIGKEIMKKTYEEVEED